jgi:hypothetical protein
VATGIEPVGQGELEIDEKGKPRKWQTHELNQLIDKRFSENGEHVVIFDVPDSVGMDQRRRADAIAVGMWRTSGRLIHGFEVKVSRSDWLRELKDTRKADPFLERCDAWWLVAPVDIIKIEEVPAAWGWLAPTKGGVALRVQKQPIAKPVLPGMDRAFAFGLIRCINESAASDEKVQAARRKAEEYAEERIQRIEREHARSMAHRDSALQKRVDLFEKASGIRMEDYNLGQIGEVVKVLREIHGDWNSAAATIKRSVNALETCLRNHENALAAVTKHVDTTGAKSSSPQHEEPI